MCGGGRGWREGGWWRLLENFRFEDENEYEYETSLKVLRVFSKKHTSESFILLFSSKTLVRLFIVEGG